MNTKLKLFQPLIIVFIILNAFLIVFRSRVIAWGIDPDVVIIANLVFFLLTFFIVFRQSRALRHANPNVFVRGVMAGTMIKMLICIAALLTYVLAFRSTFNKPAVFVSMGVYVIYLVMEVRLLTRLNKPKNG